MVIFNMFVDIFKNRVYCRVRPLLPSEKVAGARPCISISNNNDSAEEKPYIRVGDRSWGFDGVFDIYSKQQDVYNETVSPLVQSCLAGYNATILACKFYPKDIVFLCCTLFALFMLLI